MIPGGSIRLTLALSKVPPVATPRLRRPLDTARPIFGGRVLQTDGKPLASGINQDRVLFLQRLQFLHEIITLLLDLSRQVIFQGKFDRGNGGHTGQCASAFVKLLVDDVSVEKGLFAPEQFDAASRRFYFQELAKLGVTVDEIIERKLS